MYKGGGMPDPVDIHVGSRVRLRRTLLGMSQDTLAQAVGLTFQQIQKYEHGANRIGSSRLLQMAQVLEVPVGYFFDEMPGAVTNVPASGMSEEVAIFTENPILRRETLELVRAYYKIGDVRLRKKLYSLLESIAEAQ